MEQQWSLQEGRALEEGRKFTMKLAIKMICLKESELGLKLVLCEDERLIFCLILKGKAFVIQATEFQTFHRP